MCIEETSDDVNSFRIFFIKLGGTVNGECGTIAAL